MKKSHEEYQAFSEKLTGILTELDALHTKTKQLKQQAQTLFATEDSVSQSSWSGWQE